MSQDTVFFRRTWVVIPKYQRQLALALAVLQINTGLIYLVFLQFRVRDLAENAEHLDAFLAINLWSAFLPWMLAISACVAAIGWFTGLYFSNSIVGPIPRLRRFLSAIGQGDFSQRVQVRPGDAMEHLANDLNALAVDLQKRYGSRSASPTAPAVNVNQRTSEPVQSAI